MVGSGPLARWPCSWPRKSLGRLGCLSVICLPQSSACQRSLVEVRPTIPVCTLVGSVGLYVRLGSGLGKEEDQKSAPGGSKSSSKPYINACGFAGGAAMPNAQELIGRARMFQERAEQALEPISRQHYLEMAAHYWALAVEHRGFVFRFAI